MHLGGMIVLVSVKLKTQVLSLLEGRWNLLFWCSVKKIPHLNSLLTGRLERATGALEAERHSLGFHQSATTRTEKNHRII